MSKPVRIGLQRFILCPVALCGPHEEIGIKFRRHIHENAQCIRSSLACRLARIRQAVPAFARNPARGDSSHDEVCILKLALDHWQIPAILLR